MKVRSKFAAFALTCSIAGCTPPTVTFESLLNEMVDIETIAEYPDPPYVCLQQSSYDRRSVAPGKPGWFANADGFGAISVDTVDGIIRRTMFDSDGPGAITRIWLTTLDMRGELKFYIDGDDTPRWTIPAYDLMQTGLPLEAGLVEAHPHYVPGGKGGNTLFMPIPFAQHCRIVFEEPDTIVPTPKYYHVNYRRYDPGVQVRSFSPDEALRLKTKLLLVSQQLLNPSQNRDKLTETECEAQLEPEHSLDCVLPQGENAINILDVDIQIADSTQFAQTMRQLILKIEFDNRQTVEVPLSDFSGGGMGAPPVQCQYMSADGKGKITSRWPMPYRQNAKISLENRSSETVQADIEAWSAPRTWNDRTLYFHAAWRQENGIKLHTNPDEDPLCNEWNFVTINGRGVYRGDLLTLFNYSPAWYGEGDEKIYVDGETFPSHFGTGTEDYYNCSWAPVVPFHTPHGGAPRADLPSSHGYNAFLRTRTLDAIPFDSSLRFDIEMLSWQPGSVDYATTVFWYGDLESAANATPIDSAINYRLPEAPPNPYAWKIEQALEFESMNPIACSEGIRIDHQDMTPFTGQWSAGRQTTLHDLKHGDYIEYAIPADKEARYRIIVHATQASDYGIIQFDINGTKVLRWDGYAPEVKPSGPIDLGIHTAQNGQIVLRATYDGQHTTHQGGNLSGLDCIQCIRQ